VLQIILKLKNKISLKCLRHIIDIPACFTYTSIFASHRRSEACISTREVFVMNVASAVAPARRPSLERLREEVINPGWCVACGACVGLCPYLIFYDGMVAVPDSCDLDPGRCYDLCPQSVDKGPVENRAQWLKARGRESVEPIGPYSKIWWARATSEDLEGRAQYGGVVSALTALALDKGLVHEAILTRSGLQGSPEGVRVKDRAGVLACAGSIYAGAGSLRALNQALAEKADSPLLLVGLPCQCLGAVAMQTHPNYPAAARRLAMIIGLFCTFNLNARAVRAMLAEAGVTGPVLKSDFPPPPSGVFRATTREGTTEIPLERVYRAQLPGCSLCPDLTAEMADVSVGAVEGVAGLNTVIVRSSAGGQLVEEAREKGLIALRDPDPSSLEHLKQAAANKRKRATAAGQERQNG